VPKAPSAADLEEIEREWARHIPWQMAVPFADDETQEPSPEKPFVEERADFYDPLPLKSKKGEEELGK
jgi:hypothetical protein